MLYYAYSAYSHARIRMSRTHAHHTYHGGALSTKVGVEIWESHGERMWRARDGRSGPRPNHEGKYI